MHSHYIGSAIAAGEAQETEGTMLVSTVTAKAQTTLPSGVRKALGIRPGDRVAYVIEGDHAIIRRAAEPDDVHDPALGSFLDLLERDIAAHPERLRPADAELVRRLRETARGVEVDPDAAIEGPVGL
jgi:antitoxin PrlF